MKHTILFGVPGSQKERMLLHYFSVKGAADLSRFLTPDFWIRVVLQHTHDQLGVRQAATALISLHLDHTVTDNASRDGGNASEESNLLYIKALRPV